MKEPHIIELPQLQFTGVDRSYEELQSHENGFCSLWTEIFPKHRPEISPMSKEDIPYGVYRMKDWPTADRFCAALKTEGGGAVAQNCTRYNIPPQRYAFFQQAPNYICASADSLTEAITKVGFEIPEDSVCFETDAPSVAGQDQSVDIWIPVRQRNNGCTLGVRQNMKAVVSSMLIFAFLTGCIGVRRGGQEFVGIVVTREELEPMKDVSVTLEYTLSKFTGSKKIIGPFRTDSVGRFIVSAHEFTIVTTGTIFDGSTSAIFYFTDDNGRRWADWSPEKNEHGESVFLAPPRNN